MPIARVSGQGGMVNGGPATSISRAFPNNVATGSVVAVAITHYQGSAAEIDAGPTTSGTATLGTWQQNARLEGILAGTQYALAIFTAVVTAGGSLTVTQNGSTGDYYTLGTDEFSGADTSGTRCLTGVLADNTGTAVDSGNIVSGGPGAFLGVMLYHGAGGDTTITEDGAFTLIGESEVWGATMSGSFITRIVSADTTDSGSWTLGASKPWGAALTFLKEAPASITARQAFQSNGFQVGGYVPGSAGGTSYDGTFTESVTLSDSLGATRTGAGSVTETVALSDSISGLREGAGTLTDSVTLSDSLSGGLAYPGSISETLALSDEISGIKAIEGSITETLSLSDSVGGAATLAGTVNESVTVSDSTSALRVGAESITETVALSDSLSGAAVLPGTLSDSVALSDSMSGEVTGAGAYAGSITESVTLTDSIGSQAVFECSISESISLTDSLSGEGGADVAPDGLPAGAPGRSRRLQPRVAVRIDGVVHVGSYAEIAALVAARAAQDAQRAATVEAPQPTAPVSARQAKAEARRAAQRFERSSQVLDVGLPAGPEVPAGIDPAPIAARELRAEYARAYAASLLAAHVQAAQAFVARQMEAEAAAAQREAELEADDLEVIEATLEMIE